MKFCIFACLIIIASFSHAQTVRVVTEKLPPLQFIHDDGSVTGAMVDIVKLLFEQSDINYHIDVLPWARSYQLALTEKNTIIFSMLKGKEREDKFTWIGKLFSINSYLVALKENSHITIDSINDAKQYSVGSIRKDLAESYLREHGFVEEKNLYLSSNYNVLWQMLFNKRTDLAFTNNILWKYEIEDTNLDPSQIRIVYKIPDIASDLYIAASLNTDQTIIDHLRKRLAHIKSSGQHQAILQKWQLTTTAP